VRRMRDALEHPSDTDSPGMPYPKLRLQARTVLASTLATAPPTGDSAPEGWTILDAADVEPAVCLPGQTLAVQVELQREHASSCVAPTELIGDATSNPHGVLEAFWLYVEGQRPEGSANVLIAAQPLIVKDLATPTLRATVQFDAPPTPGEYSLTAHINSTSVVGCDLASDLKFVVQEDDVPALE